MVPPVSVTPAFTIDPPAGVCTLPPSSSRNAAVTPSAPSDRVPPEPTFSDQPPLALLLGVVIVPVKLTRSEAISTLEAAPSPVTV